MQPPPVGIATLDASGLRERVVNGHLLIEHLYSSAALQRFPQPLSSKFRAVTKVLDDSFVAERKEG